jgi:hypothetical protein
MDLTVTQRNDPPFPMESEEGIELTRLILDPEMGFTEWENARELMQHHPFDVAADGAKERMDAFCEDPTGETFRLWHDIFAFSDDFCCSNFFMAIVCTRFSDLSGSVAAPVTPYDNWSIVTSAIEEYVSREGRRYFFTDVRAFVTIVRAFERMGSRSNIHSIYDYVSQLQPAEYSYD